MSIILLFNKPFNVLCQFTDHKQRKNLSNFIDTKKYPDFYTAGRLDRDSEGLLLLTNDGALQNRIAHPKHKLSKTYWVQVEGDITDEAIKQLQSGVELKDGPTLPAKAKRMRAPNVWPRNPPIRERKLIPTTWLCLTIKEGRNRQVRRMTAAVGFPTLRLIRYAIGKLTLEGLDLGGSIEHPWPADDIFFKQNMSRTTSKRKSKNQQKTTQSKKRESPKKSMLSKKSKTRNKTIN